MCSLVSQSKYEEALQLIDSNGQKLKEDNDLKLHYVYCLYKLQKFTESQELLASVGHDADEDSLVTLKAQMFYKAGEFKEASACYKMLLEKYKNADLQYYTEIVSNYYACVASQSLFGNVHSVELPVLSREPKETYELLYNKACFELSKGRNDNAEKLLEKSLELCKDTLKAEGYTEEEIEEECLPIQTQLCYVFSCRGDLVKAKEILGSVSKKHENDIVSMILSTNNILASSKNEDLKKELKDLKWNSLVRHSDLSSKLLPAQLKTIEKNNALFLMNIGKIPKAQEFVTEKLKENPSDNDFMLLDYSLRNAEVSDKQVIIKDLENQVSTKSVSLVLYLVQLYIAEQKFTEAIELLHKLYFSAEPESESSLEWSPGILSVMVHLYKLNNQEEKGVELLKKAIEIFSQKNFSSLHELKKQYAIYALKSSKQISEDILNILVELMKQDPSDLTVSAALVMASSAISDASKSKQYYAHLTKLRKDADSATETPISANEIDLKLDKLEEIWNLNTTSVAKDETSADKVNKKKKKKPLPKNYDPNKQPDPERWLPMKMRSYYKSNANKKKGKKPAASNKGSTSNLASSSNAATVSSEPKHAKKQNKKKKGRKAW